MGLVYLLSVLLLWLCGNTSAATNETDKQALLEFKNQITDDPSGFLNSWNDSQHVCQWQGVSCSSQHKRVVSLNLGGLGFYGPISRFLGNLSFLRTINFQDNLFHGPLPEDIGNLFRLRQLNLTNNSIGGEIPVNLSRCSELTYIDLYMNSLIGQIPTEIGSLKKLVRLMLGSNSLTGLIPPSFGNLTSLRQVSLSTNNLQGSIPTEMGSLQNLTFFSAAINNLSGTIPPSFYNISTLSVFSIAQNQLTGSLPADIGLTLPNLRLFGIGVNQLSGTLPASLANASNLQILDSPENNFVGSVPSNLGDLQNLRWLNLGLNFLGSNRTDDLNFITSLSNCSNLGVLYLNGNYFGGEIPKSIGNLSNQLAELSLGGNYISGIIPSGLENLSNLLILALSNNFLSGMIPPYFGKFQEMQSLILYNNKFYGEIPSSLGNLTQLYKLRLSDNKLQGNIPTSIADCQKLSILDMSNNELTGPIPPQVISISSLSTALNLSHNSLTGQLPAEVGKLKNINAIDISGNKLTGDIPSSIGDCSSLEHLYLQDNLFQGTIPSSLASLKGIQELDLSRNNLSGPIPKGLANLRFLQYLNLSFNELEGEVPREGAFGNASSVTLVGNSKLCGGPPELKLPPCLIPSKKQRRRVSTKTVIAVTSVAAFCMAIAIISCFILFWRRERRNSKKPASTDSSFDKILRVSHNDLHHATEGFSSENLIGSGGFGSVYKGKLDKYGERLVAVKVFNLQNSKASKSFMAECKVLRNIRHRNFVKILTYCSSIDFKGNEFKALVYEFMAKGSLDKWLHPEASDVHGSARTTLNLLQRVNIAIDVASAMHYLHDLYETLIVHCDLKPSNILLDNDLTAHVGDFGLARLLPDMAANISQEQTSSIGIKGTTGYAAPEYGMGHKASKYGDVYSYGILLLEMVTGKRPTDGMFKDGLDLHSYAKMALPNQAMKIADPQIIAAVEKEDEEINDEEDRVEMKVESVKRDIYSLEREKMVTCIVSLIEIGLVCSAESPYKRMNMNEVLKELLTIRGAFVGDGISRTDQIHG